ncbi:unnamed protein product [Notodromas monacha]|uniref:Uncharacterized protein n=1 Tax=Notodromas monacha TaxID=399045 RepID=A0A7R9BP99_9CRUS|nr:unnamed protein product [Notodromas monacha]CAG0919185.1 unnamed protein product [Notodromas monacha]
MADLKSCSMDGRTGAKNEQLKYGSHAGGQDSKEPCATTADDVGPGVPTSLLFSPSWHDQLEWLGLDGPAPTDYTQNQVCRLKVEVDWRQHGPLIGSQGWRVQGIASHAGAYVRFPSSREGGLVDTNKRNETTIIGPPKCLGRGLMILRENFPFAVMIHLPATTKMEYLCPSREDIREWGEMFSVDLYVASRNRISIRKLKACSNNMLINAVSLIGNLIDPGCTSILDQAQIDVFINANHSPLIASELESIAKCSGAELQLLDEVEIFQQSQSSRATSSSLSESVSDGAEPQPYQALDQKHDDDDQDDGYVVGRFPWDRKPVLGERVVRIKGHMQCVLTAYELVVQQFPVTLEFTTPPDYCLDVAWLDQQFGNRVQVVSHVRKADFNIFGNTLELALQEKDVYAVLQMVHGILSLEWQRYMNILCGGTRTFSIGDTNAYYACLQPWSLGNFSVDGPRSCNRNARHSEEFGHESVPEANADISTGSHSYERMDSSFEPAYGDGAEIHRQNGIPFVLPRVSEWTPGVAQEHVYAANSVGNHQQQLVNICGQPWLVQSTYQQGESQFLGTSMTSPSGENHHVQFLSVHNQVMTFQHCVNPNLVFAYDRQPRNFHHHQQNAGYHRGGNNRRRNFNGSGDRHFGGHQRHFRDGMGHRRVNSMAVVGGGETHDRDALAKEIQESLFSNSWGDLHPTRRSKSRKGSFGSSYNTPFLKQTLTVNNLLHAQRASSESLNHETRSTVQPDAPFHNVKILKRGEDAGFIGLRRDEEHDDCARAFDAFDAIREAMNGGGEFLSEGDNLPDDESMVKPGFSASDLGVSGGNRKKKKKSKRGKRFVQDMMTE